MQKVVVSLPTRGRPEKLLDTLRINCQSFTRPNTTIFVSVDDDDKPTIEALGKAELDKRIVVDVRAREDTLGAKWNRALSVPGDVYYMAADDDPTLSKDADEHVLTSARFFPDGIGFTFGHLVNATMCSAFGTTAKTIEILGYWCPEYFQFWFTDHWINEIAYMTDRIAFCPVVTGQNQYGKTQELRESHWWATWFDAAHGMRVHDAMKIINYPKFSTSLLQKQILANNMPLSFYRGFWINKVIRDSREALENWSPLPLDDERYQRVKQRAIDMVPRIVGPEFNMTTEIAEFYRDQLLGKEEVRECA